MPSSLRNGLGPSRGKISPVSTQFGNKIQREGSTPFHERRSTIRFDIAETRWKADMILLSAANAKPRTGDSERSPSPKAASTSKSWICNHALAPDQYATSSVWSAQNKSRLNQQHNIRRPPDLPDDCEHTAQPETR